ncbi:MAG: hypothetical protein GY757_47370 [bacterium]|nr:hypothetical protein [bacterium]
MIKTVKILNYYKSGMGHLKEEGNKPLYKKVNHGIQVFLIIVIAAVFLSQLYHMYTIPIDKPYYTGKWDEPFAINSGINVLREKGNPLFYNYGGTSVYPYAVMYNRYFEDTGIKPVYKVLDKENKSPGWPLTRKITPVKPIYQTKVLAYIIYLVGGLLFVVIATYYLLPVPFWLIPSVISAPVFVQYATQMLPEVHLGILAGLTTIAFIAAIIEKDRVKYYQWLILCAVAASLTAAAKINAVYIILLPLSLMWLPITEKVLNIKGILIVGAALGIPYILINPAALFNLNSYRAWLQSMHKLSQIKPQTWVKRVDEILAFLKSVHMLNELPALLLILLLVLACMQMVKKNPAAFMGFMVFLLYSLINIANMKHALYDRHFVFLILPINLFILFPLITGFRQAPERLKALLTIVCVGVTLWTYPPTQTIKGIMELKKGEFAQWEKESRDDFAEYVKTEKADVYFYDTHNFSLPDTIQNRLIPFSKVEDSPTKLKPNEYVGLILYKKKGKGQVDLYGKYEKDLKQLLKKYKPVKTFGKPEGNNDINKQAPQANPTIMLLKEREQKNNTTRKHKSTFAKQ